jgi:hypothetical protein
MSEPWRNPDLKPHEEREVEAKKDSHRTKQPYASELDDRELEHAQKEQRPTEANKPGNS